MDTGVTFIIGAAIAAISLYALISIAFNVEKIAKKICSDEKSK
jgi:uncharacterized metal-binding protein